MAWGSTVPACLAGLVTAFSALPSDVTVIKGPVVGSSARKEAILVGSGDPTVDIEFSERDAARSSLTENYAIGCVVLVASGSTGLDPFIDRAFVILGYVGAALRADKTLGGAVTDAKLANAALDLSQVASGSLVRIPFTVAVQAFTTR